MQIKDVEKLAELAKLELSEEEKKRLLSDMEGILGYVRQIEEVQLPDINVDLPAGEAGYNPHNVWREDISLSFGRDFSREEIVSQFPDSQDGFVKVKKIL